MDPGRREAREVIMDIKKAAMALWTAGILFLAPMAVYAGNGVMQDTLGQNEKLKASEELKSENGKYKLVLQGDGNLVIYNERGLAVWAKGRIKDSLPSGEKLLVDEFIRSQNREYTLVLQGDGNLVAYDNQRKALWNSNTVGSGAVECVMQSDGNLLLKDGNRGVVWAKKPNGYSNATLLIQDEGPVVLYKEGGVRVWSNGNINTNIQRDTPPAEARHQDDAGSGRDAGNVFEDALLLHAATGPVDGELSPADGIDMYSIRLDKEWRLRPKTVNRDRQD